MSDKKWPHHVYVYHDIMGGMHFGTEWAGPVSDHVKVYIHEAALGAERSRREEAEECLMEIALSCPGPEQKFELENRTIARRYFEALGGGK